MSKTPLPLIEKSPPMYIADMLRYGSRKDAQAWIDAIVGEVKNHSVSLEEAHSRVESVYNLIAHDLMTGKLHLPQSIRRPMDILAMPVRQDHPIIHFL